MSLWLKLLPLELSDITEYIEPKLPTLEGEQDVGEMSEDLKKLYTLWQKTLRECDQVTLDMKYEGDSEDINGRVDELGHKAQALKLLFWIAAHEELKLWSKSLGARKGYRLVIKTISEMPDLPPFLKRLFGGD